MATRTARSVASSSPRVSITRKARHTAGAVTPAAKSPTRLQLATARAGDHPSIHALLLSVFQGPTAAEFHAQIEEPGYLPADRLVVKHGEDIVAHVRLARQTLQAGEMTLPAARFMDLATVPHLRSRGLATALLSAGERAAAERGVLVGITRTRVPSLFARHGWSVCGGQTYSSASPRAVLAEIAAARCLRREQAASSSFFQQLETPVVVRPLRRIELPAVVRLYGQQSRLHVGSPVREQAYWEWLLARGACDRIYVASTAAESTNFSALVESIVGYACVRQSRIVELVTAASEPPVAEQLLERVCADSREQDGWTIRYDGPARDPLHELLVRAGGELGSEANAASEVNMMKLFDPLRVLRLLDAEIQDRARIAELSLPVELGIDVRAVDGKNGGGKAGVLERYRIRLGGKQTQILTGSLGRNSVSLPITDLALLALGERSADKLAQTGRLVPSTAKSLTIANALFPGRRWWRPVFDDLLA
jgi:predicted N-acetyltransferase YhbS